MKVNEIKVGMRFSITVADSYVVMEVTGLRCGDVYDCNPVDPTDDYGSHEVYTESQLRDKITMFRRYSPIPIPEWGTE